MVNKVLFWILTLLGVTSPHIRLFIKVYGIIGTISKIIYLVMGDNGFLSKDLAKAVAKKLDSEIDFSKNGKIWGKVIEAVDGAFIQLSLNFLDNQYGDKIPEGGQACIVAIFEAYVSEDWADITEDMVTSVNALVDIPMIDEEIEENIIRGILTPVIKFIITRKE